MRIVAEGPRRQRLVQGLDCLLASLQLTVTGKHLTLTKTAFESVEIAVVLDGDEEECCMAQFQRLGAGYAITNMPRYYKTISNALFLGDENELWTRFLEPMPLKAREANVRDVLQHCADTQASWEAKTKAAMQKIREQTPPEEQDAVLQPYLEQLETIREKLARDRKEAEGKNVNKLKKAFVAHDYFIKVGPLIRAAREDAKQAHPKNENVTFNTRRVYQVDALMEAGLIRRVPNTEPKSVYIRADQSGRHVTASRLTARWNWLTPWTWLSTLKQWHRDNVSNVRWDEFAPLLKAFMTTERKKLHQTLDKSFWEFDRHAIEAAAEANRDLPPLSGGEPRNLPVWKDIQQKIVGFMMDQEDMRRPLGAEDLKAQEVYKDPEQKREEDRPSEDY